MNVHALRYLISTNIIYYGQNLLVLMVKFVIMGETSSEINTGFLTPKHAESFTPQYETQALGHIKLYDTLTELHYFGAHFVLADRCSLKYGIGINKSASNCYRLAV